MHSQTNDGDGNSFVHEFAHQSLKRHTGTMPSNVLAFKVWDIQVCGRGTKVELEQASDHLRLAPSDARPLH
eukprot:SAG31_NODE_2203_length_6199_cov_6.619836_6_plen_71_part_00